MVPEPLDIHPEAKLQKTVVTLIKDILQEAGLRFVLLETFGLDVAVFLDAAPASAVRLFEVKSFAGQRQGGIGFGNGRGMGPQVDLLLRGDSELCLLDSSVRWVFADATKKPGTGRYALLTCAAAKKAAMGGAVVRGKQNNLRVSALKDSLVDWNRFRENVGGFLLAGCPPLI